MNISSVNLLRPAKISTKLRRFSLLFLPYALVALMWSSPLSADFNLPIYYPQEEHVASYIGRMPWHLYKSYHVPGLGWFWVDNARDVVKDTIKKGKIWEPYIVKILATYIKPGDNVVDLGAHMGTISLAMSNLVGQTGMVYSFEGERQFFRELYHNIYSNGRTNIIPHLCWIGDKEEDIEVHYYYGNNYSPVHQPSDRPWILHKHKLDTFDLQNISLMKIDVECTEDEILSGAQETIARCRPVLVIEIMGGFGNSNKPEVHTRIAHTIGTLNAMGYSVQKIHVDDYLAVPKEKLRNRK